MDTIAAISTSHGVGAVSLIRISGAEAFAVAARIYGGRKPFDGLQPRYMCLAQLRHNGKILDNALVTKFCAPDSFTGEDMVEFSCHGGSFVPASVLNALLECGARVAENGEFTRRAYLNGKTDLAGAEGVIEMINAESEAEVNAAQSLLSGRLSDKINFYYDALIDILAGIEASLDYPEEDLAPIDIPDIKKQLTETEARLRELCALYSGGRLIKNGINAVIAGDVNVGKSSLLNALTGRDRAIVTDIAGTTTDIIEDAYVYRGVKVNIIDTAGVRDTENKIESLGVGRALGAVKNADIVLAVMDFSDSSPMPPELEKLIRQKKYIKVYNKIDKMPEKTVPKDSIAVSATGGEGVLALKDAIYEKALGTYSGGFVITIERHYSALLQAQTALEKALDGIDCKTADTIAVDINAAINELGLITGKTASEELLNAVFSKFCLGK